MNGIGNNERGETNETIVGTASKEAILAKLNPFPHKSHTFLHYAF